MNLARTFLLNPGFIALFALFLSVEVYSLGVLPALVQTQQARVKKAEAENADTLRQAERDATEAKAAKESQIAHYSEQQQAAQARLTAAQATIAASEAEIAKQESKNAELKSLAQAQLQKAQNELNQAQLMNEQQITYQANRLQAAQACKAKIEALNLQIKLQIPPGDLFTESGNCVDVWTSSNATVGANRPPNILPCLGLEPAAPQDLASTPPKPVSPSNPTPAGPKQQRGRVVAIQLNVRSQPDPNDPNIRGKLARGAVVDVMEVTRNGWIKIESICDDGKLCVGYVNGRSEFVQRIE